MSRGTFHAGYMPGAPPLPEVEADELEAAVTDELEEDELEADELELPPLETQMVANSQKRPAQQGALTQLSPWVTQGPEELEELGEPPKPDELEEIADPDEPSEPDEPPKPEEDELETVGLPELAAALRLHMPYSQARGVQQGSFTQLSPSLPHEGAPPAPDAVLAFDAELAPPYAVAPQSQGPQPAGSPTQVCAPTQAAGVTHACRAPALHAGDVLPPVPGLRSTPETSLAPHAQRASEPSVRARRIELFMLC